eukprot:747110_1
MKSHHQEMVDDDPENMYELEAGQKSASPKNWSSFGAFNIRDYAVSFGSVRGSEVKVHYAVFLLMAFTFVDTVVLGPSRTRALIVAAIVSFSMVFCILGYELAHLAVASRLHAPLMDKIILWPLGGLVCHEMDDAIREKLMLACAGPAFNLLLALTFWILKMVLGGQIIAFCVSSILLSYNLMVALYNLLVPVYPMDISTVVAAFLTSRCSVEAAAKTIMAFSVVSIAGCLVLSIYLGMFGLGVMMTILGGVEIHRMNSSLKQQTLAKHRLFSKYCSC